MNDQLTGARIWVRGIVQGVGFRPFIFNLAARHGLTGWVRNTSAGVEIEVNGSAETLAAFTASIQAEAPPLARIDSLESQPVVADGYTTFEILASQPQPGDFIPVSPDVAICADCRRELFDPTDRRYRYPFINCTNCGPRFTIIKDIPYDRPQTTMAPFAMCPDCAREYHDPRDRRFHAQPVACPACGPHLWVESNGARAASGDEPALAAARAALKNGQIAAVKGLGGFHLACDAANAGAVAALRARKKRSDKPFALMAFDLTAIRRHCRVSAEEEALLRSPAHPIVLLERLPGSSISAEVAPGQATLGFMLPYTPLHLLLLEPAPGFPEVLVMTSGNRSDEPIAYRDDEARERLAPLADLFLLHDREIHMRVDDSVARVFDGAPYLLRRSRGYAPNPVRLAEDVPPVLAAGAELKNAFCLTRDRYAFVSHHIGDMENYETLAAFESGIAHFQRLFRVTPEIIACDLHPNYLATRYAQQRAESQNLPLVMVQHHHAHLAACLADNGYTSDEPVIGLSYDGTGYGSDGAIWGGEVLLGGYHGYERLYHLAYTPLPGGDAAVRKPARMALSYLWQNQMEWDPALPSSGALCYDERTVLLSQLQHQLNAPLTSSMGRLFDAVAALLGVRQEATYEGQAAIELEALADASERGSYDFDLRGDVFDPAPLLDGLLADWHENVAVETLSARFHNSVARLSLELCRRIRHQRGASSVALSGGVWQNMFLLRRTVDLLRADDFTVLLHRQVPANDGGISLGQALVAANSLEGK